MRIIAGRCRGRRLMAPTWEGVRPTSDRLRETLFNVLAPDVAGASVLDVYAGTGAVGLEALSRGAASVVFVERDRRAVALLRRNAAACGAEACAIVARDAVAALRAPLPGPFDIVFLDPPYTDAARDAAVSLAARHVAPGGVLVLEHATRVDAPAHAGGLRCARQIRQGDSTLSFYRAPASVSTDAADATDRGGEDAHG